MRAGTRAGNEKLSALRAAVKADLVDDLTADGLTQFEATVARALEVHRGRVVDAAAGLGIGRRTLARYVAESPRLKEELKRLRRERDGDGQDEDE